MNKYNLVVARYNENIDWLTNLNYNNIDLKIYNKGEQNINFPYTRLENIGGDSETYIHHIIENYYDLHDYTIFIQATPFDHCENIIHKIYTHTNESFIHLSDHIITESINGWYEHLIQTSRPEAALHPIILLRDTANAILGPETPEKCHFGAGQQFIIHKDLIHNRSWEFYKNIWNWFPGNFLLCWHLERLWEYIFKV